MKAWNKVRANNRGLGGDQVTLEKFAGELQNNLTALSARLRGQTYRPKRLRHGTIAKRDGGLRKLKIPAIVDRVAQTATLLTLAPHLDPRMSEASWAYRPGRGVRDALERVRAGFLSGHSWTIDADISEYFDRVPHRRLVDELSIWIDDERMIWLFGQWLRGFSRSAKGIAQGAPISPLLANLYLHPVNRPLGSAGYIVVRYADDLVIQTRSSEDAWQALDLLGALLHQRGLSLKRSKTSIVAPDQECEFLGETLNAQERPDAKGGRAS